MTSLMIVGCAFITLMEIEITFLLQDNNVKAAVASSKANPDT